MSTAQATEDAGTPTAFTAGEQPITIQYTNGTDVPWISFYVAGPGITGNEIVPPSWFTRTVTSPLPGGWSSSEPLDGD